MFGYWSRDGRAPEQGWVIAGAHKPHEAALRHLEAPGYNKNGMAISCIMIIISKQ